MYYKSKFGTHFSKVHNNRIIRVWSDSIIVLNEQHNSHYQQDRAKILSEDIPITEEEFMVEYAGAMHSIILAI